MLHFLNSPEQHPNICHLAEPRLFYNDREAYLVLAWGGNYTLDKLYEREAQFRGVALVQALKALTFMHEDRGVVHRDVKPGNIIVNGATKLIDFESADLERYPMHPLEKSNFGTPRFVSKQQYNGEKPTTKDDIFSFAATALVVLRGSPEPPPYRLVPVTECGVTSLRPDFEVPLYTERDMEAYGHFGELVLRGLNTEPGPRPPALELLEAGMKKFGEKFPDPLGQGSVDSCLHSMSPVSPYIVGSSRSDRPLERRLDPA
jgi:serine/threonine protein kinase